MDTTKRQVCVRERESVCARLLASVDARVESFLGGVQPRWKFPLQHALSRRALQGLVRRRDDAILHGLHRGGFGLPPLQRDHLQRPET